MESPYPPAPEAIEPEEAEDTPEEIEEISMLERTQHRLAKMKARLMRPGVSGWIAGFRKRYEEEYEEAKQDNRIALIDEFRSKLDEFEEDDDTELDSEEVQQAAVMAVIDNKRKVDELAVSEQYAGKKSRAFISWVRKSKPRTKLLVSGGGSLLFATFSWPVNAAVASRLGRTHVADNAEEIQAAEQRQSDALKQEMLRRDAEEMTIEQFRALHGEAAQAMDDSMWYQREQVKKQVGPIAVGTVAGTTIAYGVEAVRL